MVAAAVAGSKPAPAATVAAAALVRNRSRREKGDMAFSFRGWCGLASEGRRDHIVLISAQSIGHMNICAHLSGPSPDARLNPPRWAMLTMGEMCRGDSTDAGDGRRAA
ncbi:hypothetical protein GCM10010412_054880 [Nonomuraea recticatena]|uniref:Uncharacterized protein n=1 Tax=Nonomuraea recticatena TaxID=46178 RepID=A0ABN3SCX6_9ACTN